MSQFYTLYASVNIYCKQADAGITLTVIRSTDDVFASSKETTEQVLL